MFTGLIEKVGILQALVIKGDAAHLSITSEHFLADTQIGDSIAVDGICLTVIRRSDDAFTVDAVQETLNRTTLGTKSPGERVNLEKALMLNQRLGGHIVQGHVDGVGKILRRMPLQQGMSFEINIPDTLNEFVVEKGSIAIDGISLTVAAVNTNRVTIAVVPHTLNSTTLASKKTGDFVNLETDILAKYVHKMVAPAGRELTKKKLEELGF
ncbi:MAG: riboflavin synthase [candidate division KSB1 bacterium]|nr:riboflavin synthase [candidate division KSB1 bacterium]